MPRVLPTQKICHACRLHFYGETLGDIAIFLDVIRAGHFEAAKAITITPQAHNHQGYFCANWGDTLLYAQSRKMDQSGSRSTRATPARR